MNEQDIEMTRAETELQREETGLHTEIDRLTAQSEELTGKAEQLKAAVAGAEAAGAQDAGLADRIRKAVLPFVDPNLSFERARQFRRASVNARREANQAVRQTLVGWKTQVAQLGEQLKADEPLVQKLAAQGQQKQAEATRAAVAKAELQRAEAAKAQAKVAAARKAAEEVQEVQEFEAVDDATEAFSPTLLRAPAVTDGPQVQHLPPALPGGGVHAGNHHAGSNGTGTNGATGHEGVSLPPPRTQQMFTASTDAAAKEKAKKRTSQRVRMQAAVDLHSDNNFFSGFSANLSDGGLFVATVNLLPIGTEVEVTFSLPSSGEKIAAHGVVRWRREIDDKCPEAFPGMGVQFTSLDPSAHTAIGRFLSEREPMFYVD